MFLSCLASDKHCSSSLLPVFTAMHVRAPTDKMHAFSLQYHGTPMPMPLYGANTPRLAMYSLAVPGMYASRRQPIAPTNLSLQYAAPA